MLPLIWGWISSTDFTCWLKVQPVGLKATSRSYRPAKRARWSCSFLKESCIMGSTWTWAAFQSVVIRCETCSDSRQHMVLYLSLERHTLHPRASASATNEAEQGLCKNQECGESSLFILSVYLQLRTPCCYHLSQQFVHYRINLLQKTPAQYFTIHQLHWTHCTNCYLWNDKNKLDLFYHVYYLVKCVFRSTNTVIWTSCDFFPLCSNFMQSLLKQMVITEWTNVVHCEDIGFWLLHQKWNRPLFVRHQIVLTWRRVVHSSPCFGQHKASGFRNTFTLCATVCVGVNALQVILLFPRWIGLQCHLQLI